MQEQDREHSGLGFDPAEWFDDCDDCGEAIYDQTIVDAIKATLPHANLDQMTFCRCDQEKTAD